MFVGTAAAFEKDLFPEWTRAPNTNTKYTPITTMSGRRKLTLLPDFVNSHHKQLRWSGTMPTNGRTANGCIPEKKKMHWTNPILFMRCTELHGKRKMVGNPSAIWRWLKNLRIMWRRWALPMWS